MSRMSFEAESSSRSAWNARAAVVRKSGARVLRIPSHVKESLTAAIVVRSLWAAERPSWVVGLLAGWVVGRLVVCWPVVGSVVVAVDISTRDLLKGWMEGPAAQTAVRLVVRRAGKTPWLVTIPEAYGGRLATEAAMEPSATVNWNQGKKIPAERRASIGQKDGAARGNPQGDRTKKMRRDIKEYERVSTGAEVGRHGCGGWWVAARIVRPKRALPLGVWVERFAPVVERFAPVVERFAPKWVERFAPKGSTRQAADAGVIRAESG